MSANGLEIERGIEWVKETVANFDVADFLHENPATVLATMGCLTFGSILGYVLLRPATPPKRRRAPPPKKVVLTPSQTIDAVLRDFDTEFLPLIGKLKSVVVERITAVQTEQPIADQTGRSYKDALEYQAKFLEEGLLKLIMRLDGVETGQDGDLKTRRKAAVKALQTGHREVDNLSVKIASLKSHNVLY